MRTLLFQLIFTIASLFGYGTCAIAQQYDFQKFDEDYKQYLLKFSSLADDVFSEIFKSLTLKDRVKLQHLHIKVKVGSPDSPDCIDPNNLAKTVWEKNDATIWICEQPVQILRQANLAVSILSFKIIDPKIGDGELKNRAETFSKNILEFLKYYTEKIYRANTLWINEHRQEALCTGWLTAYLYTNNIPGTECEKKFDLDPTAGRWAAAEFQNALKLSLGKNFEESKDPSADISSFSYYMLQDKRSPQDISVK